MGEAKELIVGSQDVSAPGSESILGQLNSVLDDIDSALQVKLGDLHTEGASARVENHYKIGLLRGADTLIRRAVAMIEDAYVEPAADDFSDSLIASEETDDAPDA